jgi:hypothetical protein
LQAWNSSPDFWEGYRKRSLDYLHKLSPDHPENIRAFAERLQVITAR